MKTATFAVFTALLSAASPSWASSFTSSATVDISSSGPFTGASDCHDQQTGAASCTASFGHLATGGGSGYGTASLDDSGLHAYTTVNIGGGDRSSSGQAASSVIFTDSFLLQHADGSAFTGSVILDGVLEGSTSSPSWQNGSTTAQLRLSATGTNGFQSCFAVTTSLLPSSYALPCHLTVNFSAGQAFSVSGVLGVTTSAYSALNGTATGDFSHTAKIPTLHVFDSLGNAVNDAVLVTGSGFSYGSAAPVPEPGTVTMAVVGIALLATAGRRSRRLN